MTEKDEANVEQEPGKEETPTEKPAADNSPAIKGLQRVISDKDKVIQAQAADLARLKGEPTLEEKYQALEVELKAAKTDAETAKAKAEHPELADVIDTWIAKGGVPDRDVLAVLATKVSLNHPETSGMRNSPAQTPGDKEDAERARLLKSSPLFD